MQVKTEGAWLGGGVEGMERVGRGRGVGVGKVAGDRQRGMRTPEGNPCVSFLGQGQGHSKAFVVSWGTYESIQFTLT